MMFCRRLLLLGCVALGARAQVNNGPPCTPEYTQPDPPENGDEPDGGDPPEPVEQNDVLTYVNVQTGAVTVTYTNEGRFVAVKKFLNDTLVSITDIPTQTYNKMIDSLCGPGFRFTQNPDPESRAKRATQA